MDTPNTSVKDFLDALAAKTAAPAGGGASALSGALGAALASMVCNFTVGKEKYAAFEPELRAALSEAEVLRSKLLSLVDEDAAVFLPLSQAWKIPKDDPNRAAVMEDCLRQAARVPMEILRLSCQVIDLHNILLTKGGALMQSDVGTGVIFCWSALYGAWMNVRVNTKPMTDRNYAQRLEEEADALVDHYWKLAETIYQSVIERYADG